MECWFKSHPLPQLPGGITTECPGCGHLVNSGQILRCRANGPKIRGAGDLVQRALHVTGVAAVVKAVLPDCGCADRQQWLNEVLPLGAETQKEP